jgi:hypothetical protein
MTPKDIGKWSRTSSILLSLNDKYELYKILNSFKSMEDVENYKNKLIKSFGYERTNNIIQDG